MQPFNRLLVALSLLSAGGPALGIYDPTATTTKAPNRQETFALPWYLTGNATQPPDDGSRSPKWSIDPDEHRKPTIINAEQRSWSQWRKAPGSDLEQRTELGDESQQSEGNDQGHGQNQPNRFDEESHRPGSYDRDGVGRFDQHRHPSRYGQDSDDSSGSSDRRRNRPGRYDQDSNDSSSSSDRRRDPPGRYDQDSDDSSGSSDRRRNRPGRFDQDSDDSSGSSDRRRNRPGRFGQDSDDSSGSSDRRRNRPGRFGQNSDDSSGSFNRPGRYDQDSDSSSGSSDRHSPGRFDWDRNRPGRHSDDDDSGSYDRDRYMQDRHRPGRNNRHRPGMFDRDRDRQNSGHQTESNPFEGVPTDSTKPHKEEILLSTKPRVKVARYDPLLGVQCPEVDSTGQFIYPPDCKFFVNCWKGRALVTPCAPGTLFNPETTECDFPHKVKCYGGELAEFPSTYSLDSSEKREPLISTPRYEAELHQTPKCPPDITGLLPYPGDCTKFLQCSNGATFVMDCGPGTVFNPAITVCDWPYNVKGCEDARKSKNTDANPPLTPPKPAGHTRSPSWTSGYVQPQPKKPECPKGFSGLLPHPDTCKKFLQCTKGYAFVMDCAPGTVYDNTTSLCDWPHKVPACKNGKPIQTSETVTTTWQTPPSDPGRGPWNTGPPVNTPPTPTWNPSYPSNTHIGHPGHDHNHDHSHELPPGHPRWQPPGHRPGRPNYDPRTEGQWSRENEHDHDHPGHHEPGHRHEHHAHGHEYPGHGYPGHGHGYPGHGHDHRSEHGRDYYPEHGREHYPEHGREPYPEHGREPYPEISREQYPEHGREYRPGEYDRRYPHPLPGQVDAVLEEGPQNRRDDFPVSPNQNPNPWVPALQQPHDQRPSTSWNYPTHSDPDESQSNVQVTQTPYDQTQRPQYGTFGQVPSGQQTGSVPTRENQGRTAPGFAQPGTNHPAYNRTSPPTWSTSNDNTATPFWPSRNKTTWSSKEVSDPPPGQFRPSSWSPTQLPAVNQTSYPRWQQGTIGRDEKHPDWQTQTNVYQQSTSDKETDAKMNQWASKTNVLQQSKGEVRPGSKSTPPQDPSKSPYPNGIYVNVNGTWGHYITKDVEIHQGHSKTRTYGRNEIPSSEKNESRDTNYDFLQPPFEDPVDPSSSGTENRYYPLTLTLEPPLPSEREPNVTDYDFLEPPFEDPVNPSGSVAGGHPQLTLTLQPPFPSEKEPDFTSNDDQSFLSNIQPLPNSSNSTNGGYTPLVLYLQPPLPDDKSFDRERTDSVLSNSYPPDVHPVDPGYRNPVESDNIAVGSSHPYASYQPPPQATNSNPSTPVNQNQFYPSAGQPPRPSQRQGRFSNLNSTDTRSNLPFVIYVVPPSQKSDNRSKNSSNSTDTNNHYLLIPYPQPSSAATNKSSSRTNSSVPYIFVLYPRKSTNQSVDLSLVLPQSLDFPTSVSTTDSPKTTTERPSTKLPKKKKIPTSTTAPEKAVPSQFNIPEVTIEYDGRDNNGKPEPAEPVPPEVDRPDVKKYDVDVLDTKEGWKPKLVFENRTKVATTTESSGIMRIGKKTSDVELFNVNEPLQEEEPPFPVYYVPKVRPLSESQKVGPPTPISGQVVRLRGGTGPRDGYVEVQGARPGWGVVCDSRNSWTLKEAHVVCRQLGYDRGAEMAWQGRNNRSSVPSWIAASSVTCAGNETRFQSCKFSHEQQCRVERDAIGVRCLPNRVAHCREDEIPHNGQCYHLAEPESSLNHAEALDYCSRRMARLIDVTSQAENDFVSEWLLQTHPEVASIMTSGVGFTTLNRTIWLWEDSSRAKFKFSKWWPGWLEDKQRPPWIGKRPSCIVMKRKYPCHDRPESICVADYFFWDVEDCATSSKGHAYVCKRPYDDIGCVYGKGNQYTGNANVTSSGKECLPWADSRVAHPLLVNVINREVREKLKVHNYCRNPNPHKESRPWCFTGAFGEREHCDIPACGRTGSQKSLQSGQCEDRHFECMPGQCIPATWVCDGEEDCTNGADEWTCSAHLNLFKKTAKHKLEGYDVEKWLNTPLKTCALRCKEADFTCRSFAHKANGSVCLLSDSNVGMSGALKPTKEFDYYEMIERSMNCDGMFVCNNQKCINQTQVCNGKNDCLDRSDESICTVENLDYAVRLAGANSTHEGRIEVKVLGHWGQVCDDNFGMINADVVCKELGFNFGALEVRPGGFYGNLDPPDRFMVDQLRCRGDEKSLRECDFEGWGVHNCQPEEAVGVVCKTAVDTCQEGHWKCDNSPACIPTHFICDEVVDCPNGSDESAEHCDAPFEVRLANGSSSMEGRVEVRHHGIWGTVCDDDFTNTAARVICRSLGYGGLAVVKKNSYFGPGEGPIWLDEVFCHGNESQLNRCEHSHWGQHNCDHNEDAGVICAPGDVNGPELPWETVPDSPKVSIDTILPAECGKRSEDFNNDEDLIFEKVVRGSVARKGTYPWQASIRVRGHTRSSHWCGAVILSPLHVLTAAHCLEGYNKGTYFVRAGDYNTEIDEGTEAEANIEDYYVHEEFRKGHRMNNDIALVLLKGRGIPLGVHIMPICLPPENTEYPAGLNCTISGFGSIETGKSTPSRDLRYGWIPLLDQSICRAGYVYGDGAIRDGMVCAGHLDEGVDTCDGDSGGPLACYRNGAFTLYGITSWGQHCGKANRPGVYTKVAYYRKWIDQKIRESMTGM